jgi:hypothetical protein
VLSLVGVGNHCEGSVVFDVIAWQHYTKNS